MSNEPCPKCTNPHTVNIGDFCHCPNCGLRWYVESADIVPLDVTEERPE